ncbi:MAG: AMIN domain-containing protein, partial [Kofleriaceae bacterium]
MRSRILLVVIGMVFAHVAAAGPEATRIQAVDVTQQAEVTRIRVHAAKPLEFTVYKLDRPTRVVLDLPRARLVEALTGRGSAMVMTPSTWAVSTVGATELEDGGNGVRLSITLARPGRYEVKSDGTDLIVVITARDPAPVSNGDASAALEAERQARARAEQASAAAQKDAAAAKALAASARGEADRLRAVAADQATKAAEAQRTATEQATKAAEAQRSATSAQDRSQATRAEVERAAAAAKAARDEATRTRADADRARIAAESAERDSET